MDGYGLPSLDHAHGYGGSEKALAYRIVLILDIEGFDPPVPQTDESFWGIVIKCQQYVFEIDSLSPRPFSERYWDIISEDSCGCLDASVTVSKLSFPYRIRHISVIDLDHGEPISEIEVSQLVIMKGSGSKTDRTKEAIAESFRNLLSQKPASKIRASEIVDYFYHEEVRNTNNMGVRNRK